VETVIENNKINLDSKEDGVLVLAIYKPKVIQGEKKSESKLLMNGFTLEEADVILRDVYAKVYEIRKRKDEKMKLVDKRLKDLRG